MREVQPEQHVLSRLVGIPLTAMGRWSAGLSIAFLALFGVWLLYVTLRPISRPTFFSDPVHAVLILTAAATAVAGGAFGVAAVVAQGERSFAMGGSILLGAYVLYWVVANIISPA